MQDTFPDSRNHDPGYFYMQITYYRKYATIKARTVKMVSGVIMCGIWWLPKAIRRNARLTKG